MKYIKQTRVCSLTKLIFITVSLVAGFAIADVILVPGKVQGIVQIGAETIRYVRVQAINSDDRADLSYSPNQQLASYNLTVNVPSGTTPSYVVRAYSIQTRDDGANNNDYFTFPNQTVIAEEGVAKNIDFQLVNPAYVNGLVTVTGGGELDSIYISTSPKINNGYAHWTNQYLDGTDRSKVNFELPTSAGELRCFGKAYLVDGTQIELPEQFVTAVAGSTVSCNYTISTPAKGAITGEISFTGPDPLDRLHVYSRGTTFKQWFKDTPLTPDNYTLNELAIGHYTVDADVLLNDDDDYYSFPYAAISPSRSTNVTANTTNIVNISACQAFINGKFNISGSVSNSDLTVGYLYVAGRSSTPSYGSKSRDNIYAMGEDYDLVVSEGDWVSYRQGMTFYRGSSDPKGYLNTSLTVYDRSVIYTSNPVSLACGETELRDFNYRMGTVTVNFSIEGGGDFRRPKLDYGNCIYRDPDNGKILYTYKFYATGTEDSVTFIAPEGECTDINAIATVDGSETSFGEFDLDIVAGTDVVIDIGGPGVAINSPTVEQCVTSNALNVSGSATDDVGIASVFVNEVAAALTPRVDDPLTVDFSATITLVKGENTIITVVTDTSTKVGSDTRTVYFDSGAPLISWTPLNGSVTQQTIAVVSGTVSDDVDVDELTVNGILASLVPVAGTSSVYSFHVDVPLQLGQNIITLVASDSSSCAPDTVEVRTVELIENRPPLVSEVLTPLEPISINDMIEANCPFIDPDINDSHSVEWDWGDGEFTAGMISELEGSGSHKYNNPGIYQISCSITDSFGEVDNEEANSYIVVYDPDGGFVTGGGWINSPVNAYLLDPSLTGKANFGFVSKYKKGATVPTGSTEFKFSAGELNFHSNNYEWLVIAGKRAQFKGTGTINGEGNYRFFITAIDEDKKIEDAFRIKIWNETDSGSIVYDNKRGSADNSDDTTIISAGSIIIHKKG